MGPCRFGHIIRFRLSYGLGLAPQSGKIDLLYDLDRNSVGHVSTENCRNPRTGIYLFIAPSIYLSIYLPVYLIHIHISIYVEFIISLFILYQYT